MAGSVQKLIDRMIYWCQTVSLGYDQSNRLDFRDGGETDCSALVLHALREAGFDTGSATILAICDLISQPGDGR